MARGKVTRSRASTTISRRRTGTKTDFAYADAVHDICRRTAVAHSKALEALNALQSAVGELRALPIDWHPVIRQGD